MKKLDPVFFHLLLSYFFLTFGISWTDTRAGQPSIRVMPGDCGVSGGETVPVQC